MPQAFIVPATSNVGTLLTASLKAAAIRTTQDYGGVRVKMTALLGKTRIPVQIDIGFGDAVTPGITELEFPPLPDAPAPKVRAYPKVTVFAEKLQAIVALGIINKRLSNHRLLTRRVSRKQ